jgi:hypothetical protein
MEGISFILQRFSYSLFSGCIINFFILLNYTVLVKTKVLPEKLFGDIKFTDSINLLIFIITAVLFSIFIEGICEVVIQTYSKIYNEKKALTPKLFKKKKDKNNETETDTDKATETENDKDKRRTFFAFILWHMCRKISGLEACSFYHQSKDVHGENIKKLMSVTKSTTAYDAVYIGSKKIAKEEKSQNIYRFRDLSFILQLLRVSFLFIGLLSFLAGIIFIILWIVKCEERFYLILFYCCSFGLSIIAVLLTTPFAIYFSRRYARDVYRTYKAFFYE